MVRLDWDYLSDYRIFLAARLYGDCRINSRHHWRIFATKRTELDGHYPSRCRTNRCYGLM